MALVVVGILELGGEPQWLGVGYFAQLARARVDDLGFLALDGTDGQVGIFAGEDLVPVQVVEGIGSVCAGYLTQNGLTTRVGIEEVGDIIDLGVDDEPDVVLCVSFILDLLAGEGLGWGGHGGRVGGRRVGEDKDRGIEFKGRG